MDYISTKEAARNWGVSIRYVQHLLSENRIPGAKKYGVSWMLPAGSKKPCDPRKERKTPRKRKHIFYSFAPISRKDGSIEPQPQELQPLISAYLAYYRGEYEPAKRCWRETSVDAETKLTAASLAMAAAMSTGDDALTDEIWSFVKSKIRNAEEPSEKILLSLPSVMAAVSMGTPEMVPDWLKSGNFSDFPADIRPYILHLYLMYLRCTENYEQLLAAAKVACSVYSDKDTFSHLDIYFALLCAVAAYALNDHNTAGIYIERSIKLAVPHGLISPLAEYLPSLGGLLETHMEQAYPTELGTILKLAPKLWKNWMNFHNKYTRDNITTILSIQEYHVALLLARGGSYREAAVQLNLSQGRIRNIASDIYGKLGVNNKREMAVFIL